MMSLLLVIFLLQLAVYLLNAIGSSTVDHWIWVIYTKFPSSTKNKVQEHFRLKREVVQLKQELSATSSQNEFAKWAKLKRKHDQFMGEYEALGKTLTFNKTSFEWIAKAIRLLGTSGLSLFIQFYYSRTPVFELPQGWLPYYVEWILSFPRAPLGTVSIQIWIGACVTTIYLAGEIITSMLGNGQTQKTPAASTRTETPKPKAMYKAL